MPDSVVKELPVHPDRNPEARNSVAIPSCSSSQQPESSPARCGEIKNPASSRVRVPSRTAGGPSPCLTIFQEVSVVRISGSFLPTREYSKSLPQCKYFFVLRRDVRLGPALPAQGSFSRSLFSNNYRLAGRCVARYSLSSPSETTNRRRSGCSAVSAWSSFCSFR